MLRTIVVGFALLAALPAAAQPSPAPAAAVRDDPAASRSSKPLKAAGREGTTAEPSYRSAFADYRPWQEPEPLTWRAANASAAALGGHLGHLRGSVERIQAVPSISSPPTAKPGPAR